VYSYLTATIDFLLTKILPYTILASKYLHAEVHMKTAKEKILDAAKELFAENGYAGVRTKEIADYAGVNETTLFRNFKSKRLLYDQVIVSNIKATDAKEMFHKKLTGNVSEDLLNVTTQLFLLYKSNYQIMKMIMKDIIQNEESSTDFSAECRGNHIKKNLMKYFNELKNKNIIDDKPELIVELYMSCMSGYLLSAFVMDEKEPSLNELNELTKKIIRSINFA